MKETPQHYIRIIVNHFTFLFQKRIFLASDNVEELRKDHIYLCNKVLEVFLVMGAQGDMMEEETWNHVLYILLGITDMTFRGEEGLLELEYGLLKVLSELWLCSLSHNTEMWNQLQKYFSQWNKHISTIRQWGTVCLGLTLRVINLLYGPTEGTQSVKIHWKGLNSTNNPNQIVAQPETEIDFPDEYVYFAWNMFLNTLGNPNAISDPAIHLKAFKQLRRVTKCFCFVGSSPKIEDEDSKRLKGDLRLVYSPDGNTILETFGPWLFEAVNQQDSLLNDGKAVAFSVLCEIFCRNGGREFSKKNLALFYNAIENGLKENENVVISAIILHASKIFSYELMGCHILIPYFVQVCEKIIGSNDGEKNRTFSESLRMATVTLLSSLICICNHYSISSVTKQPEEGADKYIKLKADLNRILQAALFYEKVPKNLQQILWVISVQIFEEIEQDHRNSLSHIESILALLKKHHKDTKDLTPDVFITVFEVLTSLSKIYPSLHARDENIGASIIQTIATCIPVFVTSFKVNPTLAVLIHTSYYALCDWLMVAAEEAMRNSDLTVNVINAIEYGLKADENSKASPEKNEIVRSAAEFVLTHMTNRMGGYPPTNGSAEVSASVCEEQQLVDGLSCDKSKFIRFFVFDETHIVSIIEQPPDKNGPGCSVIVRDMSGKYMWDSNLLYYPLPPPQNIPEQFNKYSGSNIKGLIGNVKELPVNETIMKFAMPPQKRERKNVSSILKLMDYQQKLEDQYSDEEMKEMSQIDISVRPPALKNKYDSDNKFQMSRLMLYHTGMFNISLTNRFKQINPHHSFLNELKQLDSRRERNCHTVGLLFMAIGQDNEPQLLQNIGGSPKFCEFIRTLGWIQNIKSHPGYKGNLDSNPNAGQQLPYFADYRTEVVFTVPPMMPTTADLNARRNPIKSNIINIVWTEHSRDFYSKLLVAEKNTIQIVIYPLKSGLFRVQVINREADKMRLLGPLQSGMIVNQKLMSPLLRQTALMACAVFSQGVDTPWSKRRNAIKRIAEKYGVDSSVKEYFGRLFSTFGNEAIQNSV